ncbi:unnamed protein product [Acanthoscelides obtectus]|uniref:Transmembrane protein 59 n=1 Tax=Acanthoscelides obtectus TaxID=200917 RepID=A0A9P0P814_ACAOB|nr:unnamed protein product [Acanthoscelides obtectus]CAK1620591.1 Transmembrane protein 59-like [Acanthoscelides obtectus]
MWLIAILFFIKGACSTFFVTDQCVDLCKDAKLPALELDFYEQVVCQRGCRFFNIIKFTDDIKINTTKKECHISCEESYIEKKENEICKTGCDLMAKEQESLTSALLIEAESTIVLASPDRDIELDLLSDPSLKSQIEVGFNVDYKIPETHIRTMPIEISEEEINIRETTDWLDCASRNSGIPRWILLSAILLAILVALWLSFSSEKHVIQEEVIADIGIPDDKLILENDTASEKYKLMLDEAEGGHSFLENNPFVAGQTYLEPPPKYSVTCENA